MEKKRHLTVRMELPRGASGPRLVRDDDNRREKWQVRYSLRGRTLVKSFGDSASITVRLHGSRDAVITRNLGGSTVPGSPARDAWPTMVDGRGVFVGCNRIPNDEVLRIIRASDRMVRLPLSRRKAVHLPRRRTDGYPSYMVFEDGGVTRSIGERGIHGASCRVAITRGTVVRLKRVLAADPRHSKLLP